MGEGGRLKSARFVEFVRMGMLHIFTGVDHMSFLLGLVLIVAGACAIWCSWSPDSTIIGHSLDSRARHVTGVLQPAPRNTSTLWWRSPLR